MIIDPSGRLSQEGCFDSARPQHVGNPDQAGDKRSGNDSLIFNARFLFFSEHELSAEMISQADDGIEN